MFWAQPPLSPNRLCQDFQKLSGALPKQLFQCISHQLEQRGDPQFCVKRRPIKTVLTHVLAFKKTVHRVFVEKLECRIHERPARPAGAYDLSWVLFIVLCQSFTEAVLHQRAYQQRHVQKHCQRVDALRALQVVTTQVS